MKHGHGGVGALASKVRARRQGMSRLDRIEIGDLTDSWGTTLDLFGIDRMDPVVGGTVLVTAKMLGHRLETLTEFGHDSDELEPAMYVTGEAALVGLSLLERAKPRRVPRVHRTCAAMAAVALAISAAVAMVSGPPPAVALPKYVHIEAASDQDAAEMARLYAAGETEGLRVTVSYDARP